MNITAIGGKKTAPPCSDHTQRTRVKEILAEMPSVTLIRGDPALDAVLAKRLTAVNGPGSFNSARSSLRKSVKISGGGICDFALGQFGRAQKLRRQHRTQHLFQIADIHGVGFKTIVRYFKRVAPAAHSQNVDTGEVIVTDP
jgi:hypothetical protein